MHTHRYHSARSSNKREGNSFYDISTSAAVSVNHEKMQTKNASRQLKHTVMSYELFFYGNFDYVNVKFSEY